MRMSIRNATEKLGAQGLRAVLRNIDVSRDVEGIVWATRTFALHLSTELHPVDALLVW
jgi:hypothetical protein